MATSDSAIKSTNTDEGKNKKQIILNTEGMKHVKLEVVIHIKQRGR
jgi:hypothetical protein